MFSSLTWFSLAFVLLTHVDAVPAADTKKPLCVTYIDTFDNYTPIVVAPEVTPITFYGGLRYNDWAAVYAEVLDVGVIPASQQIAAAAAVNEDLTDSGIATLNPFGTLSIYGTSAKYFNLTEFYYACVVADNGIPVPEGCGLEIYGYDIYGKRTGSFALNYAPLTATLSPMSRAILPSYFVNLQNVTFGFATGLAASTITVLYIDNVTHTNCY